MDIIARALSKLFFMGDTLGTARRGEMVGLELGLSTMFCTSEGQIM